MPEVIHVFSEQDSKGSLLAEVHRLQSSLSAMRQARDFHGANSAYLMQERDRLQKEIEMSKQDVRYSREAHRKAGCVEFDGELGYPDNRCGMCRLHDNQAKQAPAPVDAGLVQRAQEAYGRAAMADSSTRSGIIAALRVAADAASNAVMEAVIAHKNNNPTLQMVAAQVLAADVRARLLAPAKSVEERVTVEYVSASDIFIWKVLADSKERGLFTCSKDAIIFRLGLIAMLKQEGK